MTSLPPLRRTNMSLYHRVLGVLCSLAACDAKCAAVCNDRRAYVYKYTYTRVAELTTHGIYRKRNISDEQKINCAIFFSLGV